MKYKLIALDVDGTLVGPDSIVPPELVDAVAQVEQAGICVCLCTGRSFVETLPVWKQLSLGTPCEPMILIGGAMVSEPLTGRTLYQKPIPREFAVEYSEALKAEGYSSSIILDAWRHGLDYIRVEGKDSAIVEARWFSQMNVKVRHVAHLSELPDMPTALRINAVAEPAAGEALAEKLAAQFAGRLNIHSIFAPNYGVTVVEAFCITSSKWAGLMYVAQTRMIPPAEIIAVGDDVNDLPMLRAAGLGVAMPQAKDSVKSAAKAVAEPNLATFLRRIAAENNAD
ncbi:MAG: HAD family phosphatase [Planctomycetaceae bacterium]|nr:MAG: HAD family phosphatase [Planctomycetaceae bacterium]